MFFSSKQKEIENDLADYREQVSNCMRAFQTTLARFCSNESREAIAGSVKEVKRTESLADDLRRSVQVKMYSKALFPESRGDILGLLEAMDKVPNQAESAAEMILVQHVPMHEEFSEKLMQLVEVCCRCVQNMTQAAAEVFTNYLGATATVGNIDELESQADRIEADLIEQVFSSTIEDFDKILMRDLIRRVAHVSDRAENVGDRIHIIVAKRSM